MTHIAPSSDNNNNNDNNNNTNNSPSPPLPLKQILALCFIQICDFINGGAIYPYIIFMVKSFNLTDDDRRLGYYAGLLASSYYFAQLLSSMIWGLASDKYGRRPCLLVGLMSSILTVTAFGFSKSLIWAIVTRFLSGLLNGNVGITKTMLGEISTTETQARAFSYFGFSVAVSGIIGPLVGGTLSKPSEKYPSVFGGVEFFEKYPFCLPNLLVGSLSLIGFVVGLFVLPETKKWKESEIEEGGLLEKIRSKLPFAKPKTKFVKLQDLTPSKTTEDWSDDESTTDTTTTKSDEDAKSGMPSKVAMLRDRGVLISCITYGILGLMFVFYEEVTPYWSFLSVDDGGLAFSSSDIGIITSVGSVIGMIFQMFIYPRIANKIGILKAFKIGAILTIPGLILYPQSPAIALALTNNRKLDSNPVAWAVIIFALFFIQIGGELLFISIMIAISNSALPEYMGTVNGLAQSIVALTRTLAPVAGSSLLSWSLTSGLSFPFNDKFPFIVLILFSLSLICLTFVAPSSLNIQKKEALLKAKEEKEKQTLLSVEVEATEE